MQNTKKIILYLSTGYCGTDSSEVWTVPVHIADEELNALAYDRALEHAHMYGNYPFLDEDDDSIEGDKISPNIKGSWKNYDKVHNAEKLYCENSTPQFTIYTKYL